MFTRRATNDSLQLNRKTSCVRLIVAARHALLCRQLAKMFGSQTDIELLGCVDSLEGIGQGLALNPDVILVDKTLLRDPDAFIRDLYGKNPDCTIVFWGDSATFSPKVADSFDGFVTFEADFKKLAAAVLNAAELRDQPKSFTENVDDGGLKHERLLKRLESISTAPSFEQTEAIGVFESPTELFTESAKQHTQMESLRFDAPTSISRRKRRIHCEYARALRACAYFLVLASMAALLIAAMTNAVRWTPDGIDNLDPATEFLMDQQRRFRGTLYAHPIL